MIMGGIINKYLNSHIQNFDSNKKERVLLEINKGEVTIITTSFTKYNKKHVSKDTDDVNRGYIDFDFDKSCLIRKV